MWIQYVSFEVFAWLFLLYFYNVNISFFLINFKPSSQQKLQSMDRTHIQWSFAPIPKCEHRVQHEVHISPQQKVWSSEARLAKREWLNLSRTFGSNHINSVTLLTSCINMMFSVLYVKWLFWPIFTMLSRTYRVRACHDEQQDADCSSLNVHRCH